MSDGLNGEAGKPENAAGRMAPDGTNRPDAMDADVSGPHPAGTAETEAEGVPASSDGGPSDDEVEDAPSGGGMMPTDSGPADDDAEEVAASGGRPAANGGSGSPTGANGGGSGGGDRSDGERGRHGQPSSPIPNDHKPGKPWRGLDVGKGIVLCALLHLLLLFVPTLYFGIGIVQLLYIIPALILCRNNSGMTQGLLIGAGITFLLNAACFGYVMIGLG